MSDDPEDKPTQEDSKPPPPAGQSKRRMLRFVYRLAAIYTAYCLIVFLAQRWLIFPDWVAPDPDGRDKYDAHTTVLTREIDGGRVVAWFVPATGASATHPKPLAVFFHGNAEIVDTQTDRIEGYLASGVSVLIPEYRSYGRSDGAPDEAAFIDDGLYFLDLALQRDDVDPTRLVIHGRSMGGHIATEVAKQRPPRALILGSTFTSMRELGSRKAIVPRFIVRHPMDTLATIRNLDVPILIFHGTWDSMIPISYGRRLRAAAKNARLVEIDCGHNDFPCDEEERYWGEIRSFLKETGVVDEG